MSRRIRRLIAVAIPLSFLFVFPANAYGDNCGSLSDCYGTVLTGVLALIAIAAILALIFIVLPEILPFLIGGAEVAEVAAAEALAAEVAAAEVAAAEVAAAEVAAAEAAAAEVAAAEVAATDVAAAEAGEAAEASSQLSSEVQQSIRSLEQRLAEHERKLETYLKNPDSFDNKGFLKNAPSSEIRQRIIEGRANHLRNEINNFANWIARLKGGKP